MTSTAECERYQDILAGAIVSFECFIGDVLMILVIIGSSRIPSMKSSFGILTINQNLAQIIPCTACFIVFFFGLTLNWKPVLEYSYIIGGSTIVMLYIILISFFIISFNRFCVIAFPIAYNVMFDEKFLVGILILGWSIPLLLGMYLLVYHQCVYTLFHNGWFFDEMKTEKCGSLLTVFITFQTVPVLAIVITDITTLLLLVTLRKRIYRTKSVETKRREMNFARQVLVQGVVFLMHGFWYQGGRNVMPEMAENWKIFWTTSFSANLLHVFDPMAVFICNMEFRSWLRGGDMKKQSPKITTVGQLSTSMN
ncbi:unnamed protein product [Caenorhabditis brenneri]